MKKSRIHNLPSAETYEKEFRFMPWGILIDEVLEHAKTTPGNGSVFDLLCGPGYLLGRLKETRPDLVFTGVDLEPEFIEYAKRNYKGIEFIAGDAVTWITEKRFDLVLVTAGLHHLPYDQQEAFIAKVSLLTKPGGRAIIADPYIDDYESETERKLAGAKLGYEYLAETIKNGGTNDVIEAAVGVLSNDVLLVEYKTSVVKMRPLFEKYFSNVAVHKTWPKEGNGYGDYYFVLGN